ncbi:integrase [Streptomyces uncialis]|uniref:integrase n=1 Tax=Streptomyces uncialis TaxID=1048205 RepID=UPI002E30E627|nr:integrase [Streptomyces uncialis]
MTVIAAAESDPYILPMPGPDTAVVLPQWISSGNTHPNSRYRDPVWSLAPLIDNPGTSLLKIHWKNCPEPLREQMKLATWTMINGRLRPSYLRTRGVRARARVSPPEMLETCRQWMALARQLNEHHKNSLADCTEDDWRTYARSRASEDISRETAQKHLTWLTNLWAFDQLAGLPSGITRPPWDIEGVDDYLPAASGGGGENSTEPLDPQVLGPLLVWALRFVDDFADDILAAWAEVRRLSQLAADTPSRPEGVVALDEFLLPLVRAGSPLPSVWHKGRQTLARTYIAGVTGASPHQVDRFRVRHGLADLVAQQPAPCPLEVPVTGQINGKPWRDFMDFYESARLMRHLGTAAMIICQYLTGMRPQEVRGLRSGCCPAPEPLADGTTGRHLIRNDHDTNADEKDPPDHSLIQGRHYKNVTDEDGNHVSAGEPRQVPWVAITPVVNAIRVLERMVPEGELLLSAAHHDFPRPRGYYGALKPSALNKRIEDFVEWVNREALAQNLPGQAIPKDPHGAIGMSRFRRSLAWHIARRPGGLVALAIQYGHMRTVLDARTSSGYGSRSRTGMHSVLDVETALAAADTAAKLRDQVAAGEKISGPAAARALTAAATAPRFKGRIVPRTFAKKAAAFLARDGVVLYDNPDAMLICAFKRDNALCEPDPEATAPRQYDCRPGCGNAVRTDTYARLLRERADEIDQLATASANPVARRLTKNADRLRETADNHDATAQPAKAIA